MEDSFKFNIYFDEDGEELEKIIVNYILQNIENNIIKI